MELLPEADSVVRQFMPCVMDAAGLSQMAEDLRRLPPIQCVQTLRRASRTLSRIRHTGPDQAGGWAKIVKDATFWGEAALWAAARGDLHAFADHADRMRKTMEEGLPSLILH